jgi:Mg-chelatase subunit ChlD
MVTTVRRGSITFWAWTASIALHLIVLTIFAVVRFSQSHTQSRDEVIPTAQVNWVKKITQASPVIPKPRIKKPLPATNSRSFVTKAQRKPPQEQDFDTAKLFCRNLTVPTSSNEITAAGSTIAPMEIDFFTSATGHRKVCYVVDCSGSMQGVFSQVRNKLAESIRSLQPDQYFYIIFFGDDKLYESGDGRLIRATEKAKSSASDFIDSIQPAGQTNAMAALERAVQIRDSQGNNPSLVYFLTDGFELTTEDTPKFLQRITALLRQYAPQTIINTIGFWPTGSDSQMLETIAAQTGGEFVFITK